MKRIFFFIGLFYACTSNAQLSTYDFESYKLEEEADYKAVEPVVLAVADLLLTTPIDENVNDREAATDFIYKWMQGTPDYVFGTGRIEIILGDDRHLKGILYAAQAEYALENEESVRNNPDAVRAVWATLQDYVQMESRNVKLTPKLKELVRAYKAGMFDEFLKRHE